MEERNDIVIYRSEDGLVKMEALVDPSGETIWPTQKAIAALFKVDRSVITKHLRNVFTTGELEEKSVCAIFAHTASDGKNTTRCTTIWMLSFLSDIVSIP